MGILAGKVAVVTGASGGLGQSIAVRLASEGASLAVCGQNEARLDETARLTRAAGVRVERYLLDVGNGEQVTKAVGEIEKAFGQIDILVNNAGITRDGLLVRMSEADWDTVLETNLKSVFLFTKAATRGMMRRRGGAIVNISSIIGLTGNPGQANYAASKAGMIAFTKTVAKELASRGVRANAIAPGFIETKMTAAISPDMQQKMLETIPLGRYGKPDDVAEAVLFLASDRASYITGQVLAVCGGMVM
jgi:3-oxoacyl-[acyl-carrier protein] reductase